MAVFPLYASIKYNSPLGVSVGFKTLIQEYESGVLTRKQKRTYPRRNFNINYKTLSDPTPANLLTIYQFFIARAGMLEDFIIFDRHTDYSYIKEYIGTGDGSTVTWNLPSLNATSYALYIDNVEQDEDSSSGAGGYTFTAEGGDDGEDSLETLVPASEGARLTWSFTGQLKVRAIFGADEMSWEEFFVTITRLGIPIRGLLNT